jgi:hypothetical protein
LCFQKNPRRLRLNQADKRILRQQNKGANQPCLHHIDDKPCVGLPGAEAVDPLYSQSSEKPC